MRIEVPLAFIAIAIVLSVCPDCNGQENTQTRIPISLAECYTIPEILNRDGRLPMNTNMLIELIRKIEDSPGFTQDIRTLSTSLVHRFRLDGIERAPGIFTSNTVLPFSPSAFQFSKHRLLLSRLVPGNAVTFPNNTLTPLERCTLHFMLSSSIDTQVRGDEATRCGQLPRLRAMRLQTDGLHETRSRRNVNSKSIFVGDIEMMKGLEEYRHRRRLAKQNGRFQAIGATGDNENDDDETTEGPVSEAPNDGTNDDDDYHDIARSNADAGLIDVASTSISQCPVENGVIRTTWGTIAAGPLITGIAAGMVQQSVTTRELIALTRSHADGLHHPRQQQTPLNVDNRWASTLSGDLAEVALLQGPLTNDIRVGASGAWNSTQLPHWYFLSQRERLEMTDAEIRGGIDGLVLGTNVQDWRNRASQLRLSQLLDMYYSQRGVFSSNARACNRRELFAQVAPIAQLQAQTIAFSTVLDREMQLRVTLTPAAIQQFADSAAQALTNYIANSLNDVTCEASAGPQSANPPVNTATDLFVYLDFTWQYQEIQPIIATLLEKLNINRFGSSISLMNGNDATVVVNNTSTLSEFYSQWNSTMQIHQQVGLNLPNVLRNLRAITQTQMDFERLKSSVGGRSLVVVIVSQLAGINEAEGNFAVEQVSILREQVPDLNILFFAGGAITRFERFVRNPQHDLFPLQPAGTGIESDQQTVIFTTPIIARIEETPRRIINHRCGSDWQQGEWGSNTMDQYVEPGTINYYRVHPNYFFQAGNNRHVRIQSHGYAQISVCSSRWVERPRFSNSTPQQDNVHCRQLQANENFDVDLSNACEGQYLIRDCQPLYISVEGVVSAAAQTNFRCSDPNCRFPDSIRFGVTAENFGCFSGATTIISSAIVLLVSLTLVLMTA